MIFSKEILTFGKNHNTRDRRKALKVRQDEIAGLSEVGINTLVAIERGQSNPKLRTLLSILDTLGLEITVKLKD